MKGIHETHSDPDPDSSSSSLLDPASELDSSLEDSTASDTDFLLIPLLLCLETTEALLERPALPPILPFLKRLSFSTSGFPLLVLLG